MQRKQPLGRVAGSLAGVKNNVVFSRSPAGGMKYVQRAKKRSCQKKINNKKCFSNSLINLVEQFPLKNFEIKQRMLEKALRKKGRVFNSIIQEQSYGSRKKVGFQIPNGEYFGSSNTLNPHLELSKNSKKSKHSLSSYSSSKSKSSASFIANKMKQYRQLEARHIVQMEGVSSATAKQLRRLQKMHSLERLQLMEELADVQRYI